MTVRALRMMILWVFFDANRICLHTGLPHTLLSLFLLLLLLGLSCHSHHTTGVGTLYPSAAWRHEDTHLSRKGRERVKKKFGRREVTGKRKVRGRETK
jgi:hypothetical protein